MAPHALLQKSELQRLFHAHKGKRDCMAKIVEEFPGQMSKGQIRSQLRRLGLQLKGGSEKDQVWCCLTPSASMPNSPLLHSPLCSVFTSITQQTFADFGPQHSVYSVMLPSRVDSAVILRLPAERLAIFSPTPARRTATVMHLLSRSQSFLLILQCSAGFSPH